MDRCPARQPGVHQNWLASSSPTTIKRNYDIRLPGRASYRRYCMATPSTATTLSVLALRLVRDNLIAAHDAERIQADALANKASLVSRLVESKKIDGATVARVALARSR